MPSEVTIAPPEPRPDRRRRDPDIRGQDRAVRQSVLPDRPVVAVRHPAVMIADMTSADRRIAAIATGQLGTFSRAQANDAGLSDRQLRSRVQSGFLVQTGPNSFRVSGAPTSLRTELSSLLLDVRAPVWVTGPTSAALHGFDGYVLRRPFHVLIPAERNVRRAGAVIHRSATIEPLDRTTIDGFPTTSAVRTIIELARHASAEQLIGAIEGALLGGTMSEDLLRRRVSSMKSRGRHGIPALLEVLDRRRIGDGVESWLEREYLRLIREAGLPSPRTQQVLSRTAEHLVRVDCRFPGTNLVVELMGYRFHRSRSQMNRDAARLNALIADGFSPYQFTYDQVVDDPVGVTAMTRQALAAALRAA